MKVALYPGTFDPITNGHLDIVKRALKFTDKLVIGVLYNPSKSPLFSVEERIDMIKSVTKKLGNIEVVSFTGLLADYVKENNINVIVRGLRAYNDFEYEFQMAQINNKLNPNLETIFMMTKSEYSCISSSVVKEVYTLGGKVNGLVPDEVKRLLNDKLSK